MVSQRDRGPIDDNRAVSDVLGAILIIGFTVSAAVLVIVLSGSAVTDVQDKSKSDVAEQSLMQVAEQFNDLRESRSDSVEFSFPKGMAGNVDVEHTTSIELLANGNASCTTGDIGIGTMLYDGENGNTVGYEFGGVWREWRGGGSSMVSPPQIEYRNGRVALSMSQMKGAFRTSGGTIKADLNETATGIINENVTRALFSNKTVAELQSGPATPVGQPIGCSPNALSNVTLRVEGSRFASAWHQFAHRNFDDKRVMVAPPPDANVESGDTVEMVFRLRNTASARFVATDVDGRSGIPGDQNADIQTRIENTGDLRSTQDVTFRLYDSSGSTATLVSSATETRSTTLRGGANESYTFTIEDADTTQNTEYIYSIDTGDQVVNRTIQVGANGADWADFEIDSLSAPDDAQLGTDAELQAAVENTGDLQDSQRIEYAFNGTTEATRRVSLDGGETETLTFDIPTDQEGLDFPLEVRSDDDSASTTIDIGDLNYFEITESRGPTVVTTGESFEVSAGIRNGGELPATQSVTVTVRNATAGNGTVVSSKQRDITLNGTLATTRVGAINHTNSGIGAPGRYNYTVTTANESVTRNLYVGTSPEPYFVVTQSSPDPNPVEQDSELDLSAQIKNAGSKSGTATAEFRFDGTPLATKTVSISPGNTESVTFDHYISDDTAAGQHSFTISVDNTAGEDSSLTNPVTVVANLSGSVGGGTNGTITINENITARVQLLGTALTGMNYYTDWEYIDGDWERVKKGDYIIRGPVSMYVYTESPSTGATKHKFWGDADLNTPTIRYDQIAEKDYLSRTINVSAGSNLSVFASSYACYDYQYSGIDRTVPGYYGEFNSYRCGVRGPEDISISSSSNPSNLVILEDGEQVPAWGAAQDDQRSVGDILDDKIYESNGTLNLEPTQRVLLYELSQEKADPDDATPGVTGDPDYNDAVVLFEVVNRTKTIDVSAPAKFEIEDVNAPASIEEGETSDDGLRVTVKNIGESTNDTRVKYNFDGSTIGARTTSDIAPGESEVVEFTVPPNDGYDPGSYEYSVTVTEKSDASRSGQIYVGDSPTDEFIIKGFEESYPRTLKQGADEDVRVTIANVGDASGTHDVDISWTGGTPSGPTTETETIASGGQAVVSFDIPTASQGTKGFTVSVDGRTASGTVEVSNQQFVVNRVLVGGDGYGEGTTIVSTSLSNIGGEIQNVGGVEGTEDVTFTLTNRSTGATKSDTRSVTLGDGEIEISRFSLGSWSDAPGYYDYTISTESGDTQTGTIQIVDNPVSEAPENEDGEYISVEMNVISFDEDS